MEKWQFSNNQSHFVNTDSQFETPYHIKVPRAVNYPVLRPVQQFSMPAVLSVVSAPRN